ncbi:MAG: T9SS type A sorting domain-containing protein [Bacteroidetes bacterium]|nr:T9SS type A sorting domain-containing protein [Bacteroidota bacterium]
MNKKFLLGATLVLGAIAAQAQPELSTVAVFDDFSTKTEYTENALTGRGIYWWASPGQTLTRNSEIKGMDVVMSQGAYQYKPFGVGFGDSNGALPGGSPFTIDISKNGTFSFDVKNTGTEGLSVRVACQDTLNRMVDCSPGATTWDDGVWKYQIQFIVPAGETVTMKVGTPNGAGAGEINNCDFTNGFWGDYGVTPHRIRHDCDLTHIKGINITVLNSEKNDVDAHNVALLNGKFTISNFRVGATTSKLGVDEFVDGNKVINLYPNPASQGQVVHAPVQENTKTLITVTNTFGQTVYSNYHSGTSNDLSLDLSHLPAGLYFVGVGDQTQKLIIE